MKDPLDVSSDPPARPLELAFEDEPIPTRHPQACRRRPPSALAPTFTIWSFAVDAFCVVLAFAAIAAAGLWNEAYPFDALLREARLWTALLVAVGVAYSFVFVSLQGRTPGMAVAGRTVQTVAGAPLTPGEALLRGVIAAASVPGFFGFTLALFDRRCQTLHDKVCGCVIVSVD